VTRIFVDGLQCVASALISGRIGLFSITFGVVAIGVDGLEWILSDGYKHVLSLTLTLTNP